MRYLLIILAVSFCTFLLPAQKLPNVPHQTLATIKPPAEREYIFRVPQKLIAAYASMLAGKIDDIPVGQYRELNNLFYSQAAAQEQSWHIEDSIAAIKPKPAPEVKPDSSKAKKKP